MAKISVEKAVVKGHHVYLSEVNVGDIYDCLPETGNAHDPCAVSVINMQRGSIVGHLPTGFSNYLYSLFEDLKENFTVLWYFIMQQCLSRYFLFTFHVEVTACCILETSNVTKCKLVAI